MSAAITGKNILLVISGGIAAYKALELIRRLRELGAIVRCILTAGGGRFVTPLAVAALSEQPVYQDLWSLTDEQEMGHIRLTRWADMIVIAPASANLLAKLAHGLADDLASTALLAASAPILAVPAMNPAMYANAATQANLALLQQRGYHLMPAAHGAMACGETGAGRLPEVPNIINAINDLLQTSQALAGKHAIVTSGATYEPIDPVRYIANRSSGKQGHAIAAALARHGARVTLISGPVALPTPLGVDVVRVTTAQEMLAACEQALPADIFIGCAAVADWRVDNVATHKIKKGMVSPTLTLIPNPDILAAIANHQQRPRLVIGFAAETENLAENAKAKLQRKNCDWLLANDVSHGQVFEADNNHVLFLQRQPDNTITTTPWPAMRKSEVAEKLVAEIIAIDKKASGNIL